MPHVRSTISGARRSVLITAAVLGAAHCAVALAQSEIAPTPTLIERLSDESVSLEERTEAASRLLRAGRVAAVAGSIGEDAAVESPIAVALALMGLEEENAPLEDPTLLLQAIGRRALEMRGESRLPLIRALSLFHTRDAVRPILTIALSDEASPRVRDAAFEALARQTGRVDLARNADAWRTWWMEVEFLPEGQWRSRILEAQADRADDGADAIADLSSRVANLYRRLYAATPVERRPELLEELLEDGSAGLRRIGLELVDRELLNARVLGEAVRSPIITCLSDPDPENRAMAARLVEAIAPNDATSLIAAALEKENDPRVAATLLASGARRISLDIARHALNWMESVHAPAADAACLALHAAWGEGLLDRPGLRRGALERLRSVDVERLGEPQRRLLAAAGTVSDRVSLHPLLRSADAGARRSVAESLAPWRDQVETLLQAAAMDAALAPIATGAAIAHGLDGPVIARAFRGLKLSDEGRAAVAQTMAAAPARELVSLVSILAEEPAATGLLETLLGAVGEDSRRRGAILLGLGRYEDAEALSAVDASLWLERLRVLAGSGKQAEARGLARVMQRLSDDHNGARALARLDAMLRAYGFDLDPAGASSDAEATSGSDHRS